MSLGGCCPQTHRFLRQLRHGQCSYHMLAFLSDGQVYVSRRTAHIIHVVRGWWPHPAYWQDGYCVCGATQLTPSLTRPASTTGCSFNTKPQQTMASGRHRRQQRPIHHQIRTLFAGIAAHAAGTSAAWLVDPHLDNQYHAKKLEHRVPK